MANKLFWIDRIGGREDRSEAKQTIFLFWPELFVCITCREFRTISGFEGGWGASLMFFYANK